jgi:PAS domain S-box-containing protein
MRRPLVVRYIASVGLVGLVFLLRMPIEGWAGVGTSPILYLPAVTLAAWYGGLGPGLLAIVLGGGLWVYFDIPPFGSFVIPAGADRFRVVVFAFEGVLLSILMEMLHAARRTSDENASEAERYRAAAGRDEARLRAILDNSSTPIWMKDADGRYLLVNRPFEALARRRRSEVVGQSDTDLFLPPVDGPLHANDRAVLERGRAIEAEETIELEDGPHTFLSVKFPMLDPKGVVFAIGGIATDITGRKRAEQALREGEERFRTLCACSPMGIFLTDIEGRTTYTNARCQEIFGFSAVEGAGDGWTRFIHPDDRARVVEGWAEATRLGQPYSVEYRARGPDGRGRWVHDQTSPMLSDQGEAIGHVGTVEDVTDRKLADNALRRERDFAEGLIENAQVLVLVLDRDGRVDRVNPFLEQVAGQQPEEVRGADWFARFVPDRDRARARAAFHRALQGQDGGQLTYAILTRDGGEREVDWTHRWLDGESDGPPRVLAIGHDITELKEAQRRAVQAGRLAAIGQMVTGLAHESRNALQRSQACLEMLAFRLDDRPESLDLVSGIQDAQDDLQRLYEEVRTYAAPMSIDRRECRLRGLLLEAWGQLEWTLKGRDARLVEGGDDDGLCLADAPRMVQVFRNLLDNALAACHDPVVVAVDWSGGDLGGRAAIRVALRDNGPGFSPEQRRNLFEPFYTTKTQGTGLGMAIARRIVEAHGGSIAAGVDGGPGAEIVITLPRGDA